MQVSAYVLGGRVYFDEFTNDLVKINEAIENSVHVGELDNMVAHMTLHHTSALPQSTRDKLWNEYMWLNIRVLEEAGFEIIWIGDVNT